MKLHAHQPGPRIRPQSDWRALLVATLLAACGGADGPLDEAFVALHHRHDPARAIALIEPVLAGLAMDSDGYFDASMLLAEAFAVAAPTRLPPLLSTLVAAQPQRVSSATWDQVGASLQANREYAAAVALTHTGLLQWPGDVKLLERIDRLEALASDTHDPNLNRALKGNGYLSD